MCIFIMSDIGMFHEQIKNKSFVISTLTDYNCLIALNNRLE